MRTALSIQERWKYTVVSGATGVAAWYARNGVPLLTPLSGATTVTPELVNQLRDHCKERRYGLHLCNK